MTLTSDLVLRIIVSRAYLLYSLSEEFQKWCVDASWDSGVSCTIFGVWIHLGITECRIPFSGHLDLDL